LGPGIHPVWASLFDRIAYARLAVTRQHSNGLAVLGGRSIEFSVDIIGGHDNDLVKISKSFGIGHRIIITVTNYVAVPAVAVQRERGHLLVGSTLFHLEMPGWK
jgi:hypothetical protein